MKKGEGDDLPHHKPFSRIPNDLNDEIVIATTIECNQFVDAVMDESHIEIVLIRHMTFLDERHSGHSTTSLQISPNSGLISSIFTWNDFLSKIPHFLSI